MWCIAKITPEYRERMYKLLDLYAKRKDWRYPVVCVDEKSKQLIEDTRNPIAPKAHSLAKYDGEYRRKGTRNIFVAVEPMAGKRKIKVTKKRRKSDFAKFVKELIDEKYPKVRKIRVVLDNLNTHFKKSFYETFSKKEANRILDRIEFYYTPKHGSWLNMAEIEINMMDRECLKRRIGKQSKLKKEIRKWEEDRNKARKKIVWSFTRQDADKRLENHYVSLLYCCYTRYGFELSDTEIEIFHLHRSAWLRFQQSQNDYCIIFENYPLKLEYPIPKLDNINLSDSDWDVLFPFHADDVLSDDDLGKTKILNNNPYERKGYEPYLLGKKWGSFFYFLSKTGVEKLLGINKISQNVDDEMLLLSHENKLNIYCQGFPFFKYSNRPLMLNLDRERKIYNAIMANNVWKGKSYKMAKKLLKIVGMAAEDLKIKLLLEGGTLLGFVQHDGLMPWDDDIDLGIYYKDIERLIQKLRKIKGIYIEQFVEGHSGKLYYKIWSSDGIKIDGWKYKFPFIDLWLYKIIDNNIQYLNGIVHKDSARKEFNEIIFEGAKLYVPFNAVQCLDGRYKTWREMIRIYRWCHRKEDNSFYPVTVRIKTSPNGKMLAPLFYWIESQQRYNKI